MLPAIPHPELIFGICSPVGTDNQRVVNFLRQSLKEYSYQLEYFKVTELMKTISLPRIHLDDSSIENRYDSYIKYANEIRSLFEMDYVLSMLCCAALSKYRKQKLKRGNNKRSEYIQKQAFVFDQFKRPEEINFLRQVYGRLFISISIYSEKGIRIEYLTNRIAQDHGAARPRKEHRAKAQDLIDRDELEESVPTGQRMQEAFATADLFIDIDDPEKSLDLIRRFLRGLFGSNAVSPSKEEYGMYLARNAALRSLDLSRQVGVAIMSEFGEVITMGCNEVPKAGGGTYWEGDKNEARDFRRKVDENERIKRSLLIDFTKKLKETGVIKNLRSEDAITRFILKETERKGRLRKVQLMDLLEFGRIIHAEMSALCDAARLGKVVKDSTLFCTTFPCHLCAKHIVAAGVEKVIFIEPYPKSYAELLHGDAIYVGRSEQDKRVKFEPFIGISPFRYRDIFLRERRKDDSGNFEDWMNPDGPRPIVQYTVASYLQNEEATIKLFKKRAVYLLGERKITIVEAGQK